MTNGSRMPVQTLDTVQKRLLERYSELHSWRAVAAEIGIPAGTACSVAKGREPKTSAIRSKLGLPALVLTDVCPVHGVVHKTKRCPVDKAKPSKPRRNYKRALTGALAILWGEQKA